MKVSRVETRWHMAPIHDDINSKRKWRLERLKARWLHLNFGSISQF